MTTAAERLAVDTFSDIWQTWTPTLQFAFHPPSATEAVQLEAWLSQIFDIKLDNAYPSQLPTFSPTERWLQGIGLFIRECLQQCRIPALALPRVTTLDQPTQPNQKHIALFSFPWVEHIKLSVYSNIAKQATNLAIWCQSQPITDDNCDKCFATLQQAILPLGYRFVPGGKSTIPVLQTAHQLNIPFRHIGGGTYQIGLGSAARYITRSSTDGDTSYGTTLTQNKGNSSRLLHAAGLPAADNIIVHSLEEARHAAQRIGWPVVLKPIDLDRGEGVSVNLQSDQDLQQAFDYARQAAPNSYLLVERHIAGTCHRLFMAQGRLLYAVKRRPMGVIGDGTKSITELVSAELARAKRLPPWRQSGLQALDNLAQQSLQQAGLTAETVLKEGVFAALRPIETTAWGGIDEDVSDRVHPDNIRIAALASQIFGLEIAGVDIMSTDISQPWSSNGAVINEINYAPLLGGGPVSRERLPALLRQLLKKEQGRIPLQAFEGPDAWNEARTQWQHWRETGLAAYLTDGQQTLGPDGTLVPMAIQGTPQRVRALLSWPVVEALAWVHGPITKEA